jgi:hypothetical protein
VSAESAIRKLLPYTSAGLAIAILYVGWTFLSRWNDNRSRDRAADAERSKADAKIVEMYGSGNLKILNFYATPGVLKRGQKGLICYGVSNAKTVRIEPGVEPVTPSISRCVEIAPGADTKYTLAAEDESGHSAAQSVLVRVR